ncbi:MAG: hypothetical protein OEQ39_03510 [Gammaproteobacteria bacterium]|nr:hypothetical protein [Gammaproteobacteria bacterium]MDH3467085.1 hypothetical protein [Gammaproteobacteria bacterium]
MPINRIWTVLLIAVAIFALLGYPVVSDGETLIPSPSNPWIDSGPPRRINAATAKAVHDALSIGEFPIWNKAVGIGIPLLADPHTSFLSPFSFFLYLAPGPDRWNLMMMTVSPELTGTTKV